MNENFTTDENDLFIKMCVDKETQILSDIKYYKDLLNYKFITTSDSEAFKIKIKVLENELIDLKGIQLKVTCTNLNIQK